MESGVGTSRLGIAICARCVICDLCLHTTASKLSYYGQS
jgi:hypothetical protein